jgi:hypothetical protein
MIVWRPDAPPLRTNHLRSLRRNQKQARVNGSSVSDDKCLLHAEGACVLVSFFAPPVFARIGGDAIETLLALIGK